MIFKYARGTKAEFLGSVGALGFPYEYSVTKLIKTCSTLHGGHIFRKCVKVNGILDGLLILLSFLPWQQCVGL